MTSEAPRTPNNSCATFEPLIDLMLDGALEPERAHGLNDHLRSCQSCRRVKRDILQMRELFGSRAEPELDNEFVARVKETLFDDTRRSPAAVTNHRAHTARRRPQRNYANLAMNAAMIMIGCFFAFGAYYFGRMHAGDNVTPTEVASSDPGKLTNTLRDAAEKAVSKKPVSVPDNKMAIEEKTIKDDEPKKVGTPNLDDAMKRARAELAANEDEDDELFGGDDIPTEDVVLSSQAKEILESCDTMAAVRRHVSARMPVIEGGILHAAPLVMNVAETTLDVEKLLKKGLVAPGNDFVIPENMNIVFEIRGEGVHLRIEVDQLKDKEPRINVVDLKKSRDAKKRTSTKPAVKKLKLR